MPNYILYLAAGDIDLNNECRYSLLKYLAIYNLKPPADIGILVYTDAPAVFEAFEPFFTHFELVEVKEPLPTKLEFIKNVLSSKDGNFLYQDTNSYFTSPVETLFHSVQAGNFLFYKQNIVQEKNYPQFQKIKEYFSNNTVQVDGENIRFEQKGFYSTEIIGVNSAAISLMNKICSLYSRLTSQATATSSEDFALTYYTSNTPVQTVEDKMISYRHFPQFKNLLRLFFKKNEEENIPNLVKLVHHIDAKTILKEKTRYDSQPFVKKLLSSLTGKAWSVRQYQNKF